MYSEVSSVTSPHLGLGQAYLAVSGQLFPAPLVFSFLVQYTGGTWDGRWKAVFARPSSQTLAIHPRSSDAVRPCTVPPPRPPFISPLTTTSLGSSAAISRWLHSPLGIWVNARLPARDKTHVGEGIRCESCLKAGNLLGAILVQEPKIQL